MEVVALILSGLSLAVAVASTVLSTPSRLRTAEASWVQIGH